MSVFVVALNLWGCCRLSYDTAYVPDDRFFVIPLDRINTFSVITSARPSKVSDENTGSISCVQVLYRRACLDRPAEVEPDVAPSVCGYHTH